MPSKVSVEPKDPALITAKAKAKKLKEEHATTKKKLKELRKKNKK